MLLLRLHSLRDVVSKHILVISNTTFTGLPLPAHSLLPTHTPDHPSSHLPGELEEFSDKLYIHHHPGRPLSPGEDPFTREGEQRQSMNHHLNSIPSDYPPLVIMSDVDEIPSVPALKLLKGCESPGVVHLQMNQYLYSYEWFVGRQSWRGAVVKWDKESKGMGYSHGKKTDVMLASAGSHCR
jgi:beta-1,4-mannosyl-glycoprotein beta-1,4-N-acetylglucosaminyltransferase